MYPAPPLWAREPFLLVNQDFDHLTSVEDIGGTITTTGAILFEATDRSWYAQAASASGDVDPVLGQTFHLGCLQLTTGATGNDGMCVGIDLSRADLIAPVCLVTATKCYQWDWWIQTGTITSVLIRAGLSAEPNGTPSTHCYLEFDTSGATSTTQWVSKVANAGATADTVSGINVAASTWYRLSARQVRGSTGAASQWDFYVNNVLAGSLSSNVPLAPVTPFALVFSRSAAARSILVDHCRVWTDTDDMT